MRGLKKGAIVPKQAGTGSERLFRSRPQYDIRDEQLPLYAAIQRHLEGKTIQAAGLSPDVLHHVHPEPEQSLGAKLALILLLRRHAAGSLPCTSRELHVELQQESAPVSFQRFGTEYLDILKQSGLIIRTQGGKGHLHLNARTLAPYAVKPE